MSSLENPLDCLLDSYRSSAISERDKGTAFEKLVAAWLVADPVQTRRFERVELWSDWARRQDRPRADVGIDLVGTLRGGGAAAIQCKLYSPERRILKTDIDSFISASVTPPITALCSAMHLAPGRFAAQNRIPRRTRPAINFRRGRVDSLKLPDTPSNGDECWITTPLRRGSGAASWYDSRVIRDGYRPWGAA